jgi:hypothetical protein
LAESVREPGIALTGDLDSADSVVVQRTLRFDRAPYRGAGVIVDDQRKYHPSLAPTVWSGSGYDVRAVHARRLLAITGEIGESGTLAGSLTLLNLIVSTLFT